MPVDATSVAACAEGVLWLVLLNTQRLSLQQVSVRTGATDVLVCCLAQQQALQNS